jgi:hypothetical protein
MEHETYICHCLVMLSQRVTAYVPKTQKSLPIDPTLTLPINLKKPN